MSDIRPWLDELGLGQYADAFDENDIDDRALRRLTDQDLKDIGVASLGHRRVLLGAIEDISSTARPDAAAPEPAVEPAGGTKAERHEAERRQITVMFCDLVGSTELSGKLDPEELREIMATYQKAVGVVIARYDGHVAQYLGDGLMTYFGWPNAHEDDAQRAIRTGLEIIEAVNGLDTPVDLSIRVGVATGPVVVGDSRGDDRDDAKLAVGETPNLAARIQGVAAADTVVIAESTGRLVRGAFELDNLGSPDLKGIETATTVYRVIGVAVAESRFEAAHAAGLTPLVGREDEVALFVGRWKQAKDGEGQAVLLSGEPGIGKSRITQELRERVAKEPHTRLRYQCSPYHSNSAFHPIIAQLERAAGFARDDAPETKLDKLEAVLGQATDSVAVVAPLIAAMLSLPIERYPPLHLSPQKQKDDTIAALADQAVGLAAREPVLMIFEDAHWSDPTTLEALSAIIDRIQEQRVLLVITYRPEFAPPWTGHGHVSAHTLNRLGRKLGAAMVANVTGGKALPADVLDQIVAKTDGIPLFVEELTKTVLEAGFLKEQDEAYVLDGPLLPLAIPTTLQDSLMARLDRHAPVKEVAQIAACIGREFSYELLAAVLPLGDNELGEALEELVASELVFQRGVPPDAMYTFKHALVQDAAYDSLLRSRRRQIHSEIATSIEQLSPAVVAGQPEVLAHHFRAAGNAQRAVIYWREAAKLSVRRSSYKEAIAHLNSGLKDLQEAPSDEHAIRLELEIQAALGPTLIATHGYNATETVAAYNRAYELAMKLGDRDHLFPICYGIWVSRNIRGEHVSARSYAEQLLMIAEQSGDRRKLLVANRQLGTSQLHLGEPTAAATHLETAWSLYDRIQDSELGYEYAQDPGVAAATLLSCANALIGRPSKAYEVANEGIELAHSLEHAQSTEFACFFGGVVLGVLMRDLDRMDRFLKPLRIMASESDFPVWLNLSDFYSGWRSLGDGKSDGIATMSRALERLSDMENILYRPFYLTLLADAFASLSNAAKAKEYILAAIDAMEQSREEWPAAETYRVRGEICALFDQRPDQAEQDLLHAIKKAREQGARLFELRASTSLARLWQSQRKRQEAHDVLAPVHAWFTDGVVTADLKEAKALLEELEV